MARTPSNMIPLGTVAPDFILFDAVTGRAKELFEMSTGKATVIMFICNHCPFVKHVRSELVDLANEYQAKGVCVIAINSNDVENYPEDSPEKMKEDAEKYGYPFPYLYDETQDVARAYQAACTPDFYVFDSEKRLVYRGQLDDSRPENGVEVTGRDLRAALDAVLSGRPVSDKQYPSMGCNIKWRAA